MEGLTYSIKKQSECSVDVNIEVSSEKIKQELEKIYDQLRKEISMPGFRKGKVPVNIIKEKYDSQARQELVRKISPDVLEEVLVKENIKPVVTPKINNYSLENNEPFKLNVQVETYPEIQLKKYKKIKKV